MKDEWMDARMSNGSCDQLCDFHATIICLLCDCHVVVM